MVTVSAPACTTPLIWLRASARELCPVVDGCFVVTSERVVVRGGIWCGVQSDECKQPNQEASIAYNNCSIDDGLMDAR